MTGPSLFDVLYITYDVKWLHLFDMLYMNNLVLYAALYNVDNKDVHYTDMHITLNHAIFPDLYVKWLM